MQAPSWGHDQTAVRVRVAVRGDLASDGDSYAIDFFLAWSTIARFSFRWGVVNDLGSTAQFKACGSARQRSVCCTWRAHSRSQKSICTPADQVVAAKLAI